MMLRAMSSGQLATSLDLVLAGEAAAEPPLLRQVVLVVRPDRERVGAGDRDLQVVLRGRLQEGELVVVVRLAERDGADRGRLRVVLVVERAHGAARLEAVRVRDCPGIHLAALLLAVPDPVDARRLLESHAVAARPAGDLVGVPLVLPEKLDELLVVLDADLLAPLARMLDVALLERLAGRGLHEPRRLGQRADLVRQELDFAVRAHAAASVVAVFAFPSRPSFSRATGSETYWRSPFGTSAISSTPRSRRALDEGCDLPRLLRNRAPRVEDAGEEQLVEALGDVVDARRVEVDPDRVHGQLGEPAARAGAPRRRTSARERASGRRKASRAPRRGRPGEASSSRARNGSSSTTSSASIPSSAGFRTPSAIVFGVTPVPCASANGDGSVTMRGAGQRRDVLPSRAARRASARRSSPREPGRRCSCRGNG